MYADDTTICHQRNYVLEIENMLNKKYVKACNWLVDNKSFVDHFDEYKTKCILFSREKSYQNLTQRTITIEYLSEESIAMKSLRKFSTKLQFLHSQ